MTQDLSFPYRRIVVVGTTSSGKSTLAKCLADKLSADFIELDALHWEPNWKEAEPEVFRARVQRATCSPDWVVAGNYHVVRDLIWPRAEVIIWLDYPLWTIFWQLTKRTFSRWWTQELLWGTNRETLWPQFILWSQDSLYYWLFKTYWQRKREYPTLFAAPSNAHLTVFHFRSPREADEWLRSLEM